MHIHAPKIGSYGDLAPQMGSNINETPKRHTRVSLNRFSHEEQKSVDMSDL